MVNGAKNELKRFYRNVLVDIEAYKETVEVAKDSASGIMYVKLSNKL